MSYQEPNQAPFGPPPQQQGQAEWGQQQNQNSGQGTWGQPGAAAPEQSWGSQQSQIPQQPSYPNAPGYGQPGQPQDFAPQQFNPQQQGFGQGQGYATGPQGYMPQTDFGSGAGYGPGYPAPNQGNSTLATVALWLGIFFGWGIINLVIAILAIKETGPGKKQGRNKAITGLILTLAWAVVWIGVTIAVTNHAKNDIASLSAAPTTVATASSTGGTSGSGSSGIQATTGGSGDAGCTAAQAAFKTFNSSTSGSSDTLTAVQTLGNALESAAGQSQSASSQLKTVGQDFLTLASSSAEPPSMVTDMEALDEACGASFTFGG